MTKYISTDTGAQVDEAIGWIRDIFDGTDLANIGDLSMSGTLDLGTNTIYDGNMTGNWAMNGGNVSGMGTLGCGAITSSGTISLTDKNIIINNASASGTSALLWTRAGTERGRVAFDASVSNLQLQADGEITFKSLGETTALTLGLSQKATFSGAIATTSTAVDSIKTAGGVSVAGMTVITGTQAISASADNLDIGNSSYLTTGTNATVTGFAGGVEGRIIRIVATGATLTLANESASSTATNRIRTATGADTNYISNGTTFIYSGSRWREI